VDRPPTLLGENNAITGLWYKCPFLRQRKCPRSSSVARSTSNGRIHMPKVQTSIGQRRFAFYGLTVWNNLPGRAVPRTHWGAYSALKSPYLGGRDSLSVPRTRPALGSIFGTLGLSADRRHRLTDICIINYRHWYCCDCRVK